MAIPRLKYPMLLVFFCNSSAGPPPARQPHHSRQRNHSSWCFFFASHVHLQPLSSKILSSIARGQPKCLAYLACTHRSRDKFHIHIMQHLKHHIEIQQLYASTMPPATTVHVGQWRDSQEGRANILPRVVWSVQSTIEGAQAKLGIIFGVREREKNEHFLKPLLQLVRNEGIHPHRSFLQCWFKQQGQGGSVPSTATVSKVWSFTWSGVSGWISTTPSCSPQVNFPSERRSKFPREFFHLR